MQVHVLPKHSHSCQNTHTIVKTPPHYKTHTYTHPHITEQVKTITVYKY